MKRLIIFTVLLALGLTGCQQNSTSNRVGETEQITRLEQKKDYQGLIELYQKRVQKRESLDDRLKLANYYLLVNDPDSAIDCLNGLVEKEVQSEQLYLLYAKSLLRRDVSYLSDANALVLRATQLNPKSGEGYNMLGITQMLQGEYSAALVSFNEAWVNFYDSDKITNNLAVLSILQRDYRTALSHLSSLYNTGSREPEVIYNLVYALVKLGDDEAALELSIENKLTNNPIQLIRQLKQLQPEEAFVIARKQVTSSSDDVVMPLFSAITPLPINATKNSVNENEVTLKKTGTKAKVGQKESGSRNSSINGVYDARVGEHKGYSRVVIETNSKITYSSRKLGAQQYELVLKGVEMDNSTIQRLVRRIKANNRNFESVKVSQNANSDLIILINTRNVSNIKHYYLAPAKNQKHRIVLDFQL